MRTIFVIGMLVAIAGAPLIAPASADHGCNGIVTTIEVPGATALYLDDRSGVNAVDHWIYQEANGVAGYQSGSDGSQYPANDVVNFNDPCDHVNPDFHIF